MPGPMSPSFTSADEVWLFVNSRPRGVGAHSVSGGDPAAVGRELRDGGGVLVLDVRIRLERVLERTNDDTLPIRVDDPLRVGMPTENSGAACAKP